MKKLLFLLLIIILGTIQLNIPIKPDLLLISMVLASLFFEFRWAFILSIFAGIFKDVFSAAGLGINTFLFGLWSFLIARLSKEITLDNNVTVAVLIFIVSTLHNIITGLVLIYLGSSIPIGIFLRITSIESICTVAVLPLVFRIYKPFYSQSTGNY